MREWPSWLGYDLFAYFLPAARILWSRGDPYTLPGFHSPPWTLSLFLPLLPFPAEIAGLIWVLSHLSLTIYAFDLLLKGLGHRRDWRRAARVTLLSATFWSVQNLLSGQVSSLVLTGVLGAFLWDKSWLAIPLLVVKPNLGFLPTLIWFKSGLQRRRVRLLALGALAGLLPCLPPLLLCPESFPSWLRSILRPEVMGFPESIGGFPILFDRAGWPSVLALAPMVGAAILALRRPSIPVLASATLLVSPYSRSYDFVLLGLAIPFMSRTKMGLVIALAAVALPLLYRLIAGRYYVGADIVAATVVFVYCWLTNSQTAWPSATVDSV